MRYVMVSDNWMKDNYTGKHYSLKDAVDLLNNQESELTKEKREK